MRKLGTCVAALIAASVLILGGCSTKGDLATNVPFNRLVENLAERGVTFDVCEITLKNRSLDRKSFIPESMFVPSGVAEIAKLQARGGFAYIKP